MFLMCLSISKPSTYIILEDLRRPPTGPPSAPALHRLVQASIHLLGAGPPEAQGELPLQRGPRPVTLHHTPVFSLFWAWIRIQNHLICFLVDGLPLHWEDTLHGTETLSPLSWCLSPEPDKPQWVSKYFLSVCLFFFFLSF